MSVNAVTLLPIQLLRPLTRLAGSQETGPQVRRKNDCSHSAPIRPDAPAVLVAAPRGRWVTVRGDIAPYPF